MSSNASLYIHIPFCHTFCDYCDFYSINKNSVNDEYITAFLSALINDIKYQIDFFNIKKIPTAYIGGGTPSVLGEKICILFDALKTIPAFSPEEFTIEANPESLSEDFLFACLEGCVNRLSLGVQTFHEPSRNAVNRAGSFASGRHGSLIEERVALASKYFNTKNGLQLSADLITGLPFQNEEIIMEDIKRLLDFEPSHVSLYSLSVERDTPLEEKLKTKSVSLPDRDNADSLWLAGRDALLKAGFEHYEVSNFSLNKNRGNRTHCCLHNMRYWQMESWLGAGPAASGTIVNEEAGTAKRFTFVHDTDAYIKEQLTVNREQLIKNREQLAMNSKGIVDFEELGRDDFLKECILMGFRCKDGPDPQKFQKRFGITIEDCIPKTMANWKDKDIMLFLNQFLVDAFEELG